MIGGGNLERQRGLRHIFSVFWAKSVNAISNMKNPARRAGLVGLAIWSGLIWSGGAIGNRRWSLDPPLVRGLPGRESHEMLQAWLARRERSPHDGQRVRLRDC